MINYQHQISSRMFHFLNPLSCKASQLTSKIHRRTGLMLSMGEVESLSEFLLRIVMQLHEFNLFSDKSVQILLIFPSICLNFHVFQNLGGSCPPPLPASSKLQNKKLKYFFENQGDVKVVAGSK